MSNSLHAIYGIVANIVSLYYFPLYNLVTNIHIDSSPIVLFIVVPFSYLQ